MNTNFPFAGLFLQQIADFSDDIFFAAQLHEIQLLYLSPAFEQICKISRDTAVLDYRILLQMVHPDDLPQVTQIFYNIKTTGKTATAEFRITVFDNEEKWIKTKYYLTQYNSNDIIIGVATDITAEKGYRSTIYKYFDKKNTILDIMAHDLTSPLNNINMYAKVLLDYGQNSNDETTIEMLEKITEISHLSINKIYGLFDKEFLDVSEEVLKKENADVIQHTRELIEEYQRGNNLVYQHFYLNTSVDQLFMNVDVVKIMQVITNLLSNALKFTHDDGNIWTTIEDEGEQVLFSVKDDGIGIPAEMQPFIFDRFTKAKRPGLKGEPTVGLGLHIISNIVRLHNGKIWLESNSGQGTTFFMRIPKFS